VSGDGDALLAAQLGQGGVHPHEVPRVLPAAPSRLPATPRRLSDAPRKSLDVSRKPLDAPRKSLDVPRKPLDVPRKLLDAPRKAPDIGPKRGLDDLARVGEAPRGGRGISLGMVGEKRIQ
jgi:aarF domain-containing kinase